eukprot:CAMPEP_0117580076 /NCGR_PEP_ID=MMETSP0784-20121206/64986_1 /TAXON_ID=39447 /ORGANISM="" /LENGTH=1000 /DNA_ID=CAMNT_0005380067 /DNA_START=211 /DNA_END=3209 /DNA_ORIENTATION=-
MPIPHAWAAEAPLDGDQASPQSSAEMPRAWAAALVAVAPAASCVPVSNAWGHGPVAPESGGSEAYIATECGSRGDRRGATRAMAPESGGLSDDPQKSAAGSLKRRPSVNSGSSSPFASTEGSPSLDTASAAAHDEEPGVVPLPTAILRGASSSARGDSPQAGARATPRRDVAPCATAPPRSQRPVAGRGVAVQKVAPTPVAPKPSKLRASNKSIGTELRRDPSASQLSASDGPLAVGEDRLQFQQRQVSRANVALFELASGLHVVDSQDPGVVLKDATTPSRPVHAALENIAAVPDVSEERHSGQDGNKHDENRRGYFMSGDTNSDVFGDRERRAGQDASGNGEGRLGRGSSKDTNSDVFGEKDSRHGHEASRQGDANAGSRATRQVVTQPGARFYMPAMRRPSGSGIASGNGRGRMPASGMEPVSSTASIAGDVPSALHSDEELSFGETPRNPRSRANSFTHTGPLAAQMSSGSGAWGLASAVSSKLGQKSGGGGHRSLAAAQHQQQDSAIADTQPLGQGAAVEPLGQVALAVQEAERREAERRAREAETKEIEERRNKERRDREEEEQRRREENELEERRSRERREQEEEEERRNKEARESEERRERERRWEQEEEERRHKEDAERKRLEQEERERREKAEEQERAERAAEERAKAERAAEEEQRRETSPSAKVDEPPAEKAGPGSRSPARAKAAPRGLHRAMDSDSSSESEDNDSDADSVPGTKGAGVRTPGSHTSAAAKPAESDESDADSVPGTKAARARTGSYDSSESSSSSPSPNKQVQAKEPAPTSPAGAKEPAPVSPSAGKAASPASPPATPPAGKASSLSTPPVTPPAAKAASGASPPTSPPAVEASANAPATPDKAAVHALKEEDAPKPGEAARATPPPQKGGDDALTDSDTEGDSVGDKAAEGEGEEEYLEDEEEEEDVEVDESEASSDSEGSSSSDDGGLPVRKAVTAAAASPVAPATAKAAAAPAPPSTEGAAGKCSVSGCNRPCAT